MYGVGIIIGLAIGVFLHLSRKLHGERLMRYNLESLLRDQSRQRIVAEQHGRELEREIKEVVEGKRDLLLIGSGVMNGGHAVNVHSYFQLRRFTDLPD